jgi:beta-galactosidase
MKPTALSLRYLFALLTLCVDVSARVKSSFDTNWLFKLGDDGYAPSCNPSAFATNLSGTFCKGSTMIFVSSRELCESACCGNPDCTFWQWCEQPCLPQSPGWGCYNGYDTCPSRESAVNWTTMARATPPTPTPPPTPCMNASQPCSPTFVDADWRSINTPHDFVVEGAYSPTNDLEHGFLPFNVSWYRRHFTIDASRAGSVIWIDFDGVYKNSDVWLNGVYLGHQTSGYVAFRYFLHNVTSSDDPTNSNVLRFGSDNVLAVRVDALSVQEGWFYEGGGIYRHVSLTISDPLFIMPVGVFLPSSVTGSITSGPLGVQGPQSADSASVMPQTDVKNARSTATQFSLTSEVLDASSGILIGAANNSFTLPPGGSTRIFQEVALPGPVQLWNTAPRPPLYTVRSTVWVAGAAVDAVVTTIGIRSAVWTPTAGFQLNGLKTPVQGFSNHQSWSGCGNAVPKRVDEFRITALKALGANMWRGSYPANNDLMDLADAHGMLMWVENRFLQYKVQPLVSVGTGNPRCQPLPGTNCPGAADQDSCTKYYVPCSLGKCNCVWSGSACFESPDACSPSIPATDLADPQLLQDIHDMVLRDRNHPSVVIWCLCNEGGCDIGDADGGVLAAQFKAAINAADTTRPITANTEWSVGSPDTLTTVLDVMTTSYNYGTYEIYHRHHPFRPFMGGESASCNSDRGYYGPTNGTRGLLNGDSAPQCCATAWAAAAGTDWASGNVAWTGHDYKGEPGTIGWPDVGSHFGAYDIAGFEKDIGAYYRSWWLPSGSTFVRASPRDWTAPVAVGAPVSVFVFTGAAAAEALVNGVSVAGRKNVTALGFADFGTVPFAPGNLTAVAYDRSGGVVAMDSVLTAGVPTALQLSLEDNNGRAYVADGQDVALVRCAVVDSKGQVVPGASDSVTFTVSGPGAVYGVGNGDPANHTPDKVGRKDLPYGGVWTIPTYMGLVRAIVQTLTGRPGKITIHATAPGLLAAEASFAAL